MRAGKRNDVTPSQPDRSGPPQRRRPNAKSKRGINNKLNTGECYGKRIRTNYRQLRQIGDLPKGGADQNRSAERWAQCRLYAQADLYLTEDECLEVREFVIDKLTELRRGLDLRLMKNGFHDYLQWKQNENQLHWSELLLGRMSERVTAYRDRRQQNIDKQKVALEIRAMNISWNEQVQVAKERLGMSQSSYARALKRKI
jgi:hypothetical protein